FRSNFTVSSPAKPYAWPSTGNGCGTNCCAAVTPSRTCAPSSLISSGKSTLNAVTWAPSNSLTCSNPTASRKTSRLAACACAQPLHPNHHPHPRPRWGPNGPPGALGCFGQTPGPPPLNNAPPALTPPSFLPPPQPLIT